MEYIEIIKSNRKTISVEIKGELCVIVRAPMRMKNAEIEKFIEEKRAWIEKHLMLMKARNIENEQITAFTDDELRTLYEQAQMSIPPRLEALSRAIGVSYEKVTIRSQVSCWGSCSAKGNLSLNCLLVLCPKDVIDYVIIHELCHRRHMNHSKAFWATVEKHCPDYKAHRGWLKENGNKLIKRLVKKKAQKSL